VTAVTAGSQAPYRTPAPAPPASPQPPCNTRPGPASLPGPARRSSPPRRSSLRGPFTRALPRVPHTARPLRDPTSPPSLRVHFTPRAASCPQPYHCPQAYRCRRPIAIPAHPRSRIQGRSAFAGRLVAFTRNIAARRKLCGRFPTVFFPPSGDFPPKRNSRIGHNRSNSQRACSLLGLGRYRAGGVLALRRPGRPFTCESASARPARPALSREITSLGRGRPALFRAS
jgi:hypothetical protein